ncbi:MAG TPA: acyl-CoA dehydrogenase family protein [Mycobacterium sp.]|nr:acyl-CoA dehydrogenase family protein [Mycobacterium sp.]
MDFTTTEAADDLSGLVRTITESVCTPEHQRDLDRLDQRVDRELWRKLIDADVLSAVAPESVGGAGFGVLEQVAVLTALGRQLAAAPYLDSVVLGAGALARFATPELQQLWAVPAIAGEKILSVALDGEMGQGPVQATTAGDGYRLTGTRTLVGYAPVADAFLVPAETGGGVKVFLVSALDSGVSVTALDTTGMGSVGQLDLQGVEVVADRVVGGDADHPGVLEWLTALHTLGLTAYQLGVLERALELTAEYARIREQFGRPIGSFQAVAQRLADNYIDLKGLRLTLAQAAWRLSENLPADVEVATAAFWAAEGGHRVAHTTVHVHGGVGIDIDHPVHRYFLAAKQAEFALGSATGQLRRIGRELADSPA